MTGTFTESIKRMMGWCPNVKMNRNLEHIRIEKHEHYFLTSYENGAYASKKMKILLDYQGFTVLYAGCAAFFIFLIAGLAFPDIFFFAVLPGLSFFLTSVILFLQDRTTLEFSPNAIIIKRPFFKNVEISGENILKIEVAKNPNNRFRRAMISLVIIALIYGSINTIAVLSRSMVNDPAPFFILIGFQQSTLLIFITVLAYKWYIRSPFENFLKITSRQKREIAIYVDDSQKLANKLGVVQ